MADEWYFRIAGVERGPISFPGLVNLARAKQLSPADEVRHGRDGSWVRAESFDGIFVPAAPALAAGSAAPAAGTAPASADALAFAQDLAEFTLDADGAPAPTPCQDNPDEWYTKSLGLEFGPIPLADLLDMGRRGVLAATDSVRRGAGGEWLVAARVPELRQAIEAAAVAAPGGGSAATTAREATHTASVRVAPSDSPSQAATASTDGSATVFRGPSVSRKSAIALISLVALFGGTAGWMILAGTSSERRHYDQLAAIYAEMKQLRETRAPDAAWTKLTDRVKRDVMPWVDDVADVGASASPARRELLAAGGDHLLPMLGESRRTPGPHEEAFLRHLSNAREYLEGRTPSP